MTNKISFDKLKMKNKAEAIEMAKTKDILSKLELGDLKEGADIQVTPIGSDLQSNAKYSSDVFYCTYED